MQTWAYQLNRCKDNGGTHGSSSHLANDEIVAGAHFVTAVQTIISRRLSPFDIGVITIGSFDGAGTFNVIKDSIEREVKRLVKGLETEFDVSCELTYLPLYNNPELTEKVAKALKNANVKEITEVKEVPPMAPSEDFAYYAEKFPACFFYIACTPKGVENPCFNHHPKFDIDEDALLVAAKAVGQVVCSMQ